MDSTAAQKFADRFDMPFWEVSTKSDSDKEIIESIFTSLAEKLHKEKPVLCLKSTGGTILRTKAKLEENVNLKCEKGKLEKPKEKTCCGSK